MNARRLALLGLDAPLSAIMLAVLGIWPEDDQQPPVVDPGAVASPVLGGGGTQRAAQKVKKRAPEWRKPEQDEIEELARLSAAFMMMTAAAVMELA